MDSRRPVFGGRLTVIVLLLVSVLMIAVGLQAAKQGGDGAALMLFLAASFLTAIALAFRLRNK